MLTQPAPQVVGLLVDSTPPARIGPFLGALSHWCRPSILPDTADADAWIALSPRVVDPRRVPAAVWVANLGDWDANEPAVACARAVLTEDAEVAARAGDRAVVVGDGIDVRGALPVTPFVRSRWRKLAGLPPDLVIHLLGSPAVTGGNRAAGTSNETNLDATGSGAVADDLIPTGLAVAAAVVATGPVLAHALAWAAPTVTDAESAAALGAIDGEHVLVATPDEMGDVASALAVDHVQGGSLGRKGRRLVEQMHDMAGSAALTAQLLGLRGETSPSPVDVLAERLAELWVADDTPIVARAGASLGLSSGDPA